MTISSQQYDNLMYNIDQIVVALGCTIDNISTKYPKSGINRSTYMHWKRKEHSPRESSIIDLASFYDTYFFPALNDWKDLIDKKLGAITLKVESSFADTMRYRGEYYIYYFSNHYSRKIHGGKLKVYIKDKRFYARLVLGIQDDFQFVDPDFLRIFNAEDVHVREAFRRFKDKQETPLRRRCYLYEGKLYVDGFTVRIEFSGIDHRQTHKQTLLLNVKRQGKRTGAQSAITSYMGGIGLMLAPPNEAHPQIRTYKMGISSVKLSLNDEELITNLQLNITQFQRICISEQDDQSWYDLVLLRDQEMRAEK